MELDGFKDLEQQRQAREDFFEKSFDPTYIEKGKRGGTGEIREWKDGKYQKQSDGTWKPVKDGGVKKEDSSSIVGKKFNHEGLTYQVTKQGATQSEAVAITESKKGKRITIDNKVIEKQAGSSKGESKQPTTLSEFREYLKKQGEAKGDKELVQYAKTATTETLKKRWESFRSGEEPKKTKIDEVAEYMLEQGMQATTNQVIQASSADWILSPKEIEEVKKKLIELGEPKKSEELKVGSPVKYTVTKSGGVKIPFKGTIESIDKDGKYAHVRNSIRDLDYIPVKDLTGNSNDK